jgi:Holliday junction resolvasome RuvABC endonuclease subunit
MSVDFFIDPGFRATAIVVYDRAEGRFRTWETYHLNEPSYKLIKKGLGTTVADIYHLEKVAKFFQGFKNAYPEAERVFIEAPGGSQSNRASRTLGYVLGLIIGWAKAYKMTVHSYTAFKLKKTLTGDNNASKEAVEEAVRNRWPAVEFDKMSNKDREHICDAMGLIIVAKEEGDL